MEFLLGFPATDFFAIPRAKLPQLFRANPEGLIFFGARTIGRRIPVRNLSFNLGLAIRITTTGPLFTEAAKIKNCESGT